MIDEQRRWHFVRHFLLPGKNAVPQPPLENFQIRQTMCDMLFVRFSNMAMTQATMNPPRVACCLHYTLCYKN